MSNKEDEDVAVQKPNYITTGIIAAATILGGYGAYQGHMISNYPEAELGVWTTKDASAQTKEIMKEMKEEDSKLRISFKNDFAQLQLLHYTTLEGLERRVDSLEQCKVEMEVRFENLDVRIKELIHLLKEQTSKGRSK